MESLNPLFVLQDAKTGEYIARRGRGETTKGLSWRKDINSARSFESRNHAVELLLNLYRSQPRLTVRVRVA